MCVCSGTKQYEVRRQEDIMRINIIGIDYWLIKILYATYLDTCTFKYYYRKFAVLYLVETEQKPICYLCAL